MKTKHLLVMIATAAFAASAAADTATVGVSAAVAGTCKYTTAAGTVAFTLDPATGGVANGSITQPVFWCTKGSSWSITDDNGANEDGTTYRMKHATADPSEYMPYSFSYTATGTGAGKNSPVTMDITASVANDDYVDARVGDWADTVTLTITP